MNYDLNHFSFDRGIERIIRSEQPDIPLPDAGQLPPNAQVRRPELDRLLVQPNLQDHLASQMQPDISDQQSLLTPQGFRRALNGAVASLRKHASNCTAGSDKETTISKAARVLHEEADLRDLLSMYRSVLYQG